MYPRINATFVRVCLYAVAGLAGRQILQTLSNLFQPLFDRETNYGKRGRDSEREREIERDSV